MIQRRRQACANGLVVLGERRPIGGGPRARAVAERPRPRWLVPLVVFLCVTGVLLLLAASVEALAPFIYAIF